MVTDDMFPLWSDHLLTQVLAHLLCVRLLLWSVHSTGVLFWLEPDVSGVLQLLWIAGSDALTLVCHKGVF